MRLFAIAFRKDLAQNVTALILQRTEFLRNYRSFERWQNALVFPKESQPRPSPPSSPKNNGELHLSGDSEEEEVDDSLGGEGTDVGSEWSDSSSAVQLSSDSEPRMTRMEWLALSLEEKQQLYREYEADRLASRAFAKGLRFRALGSKQAGKPAFAAHARAVAQHQSANVLFDQAIARLVCVKEFRLDRLARSPWRRLRWRRDDIYLYQDEDDEDETLQLSYTLRALGCASYFYKNIRSLDIITTGPAFWTADGLRRQWEEAAGVHSGWTAVSLDEFARQVFIIEHTFVHLTKLKCAIRASSWDFRQLVPASANFLLGTEGLESVNVRIVRTDFTIGVAYPPSDEEVATDLLAHLDSIHWPRIRELSLSLTTTEETFLAFLSRLARTLRYLSLTFVRLAPVTGSWESTLARMSHLLKLEDVSLLKLWDDDSGTAPEGRKVLDFEASEWNWDKEEICYDHYHAAIRAYLLRETNTLPQLRPNSFLDQHSCENGQRRGQ